MTEKKLWTLTVDEEFKALIPPLSAEERQMLEDSIVRDGCDTPLTVWEGTIVDGHNRYDICQEHGVPFAYEEREFEDRDAAVFWMLEHQLARRNLNSYQRSILALRFEPMLRKTAISNQGKRNDLDSNFQLNLAGSSNGYSAEKMAELAGVSPATIKRVKKIEKEADEETKQQLRRGDQSIHKAYTSIMNKEHEGETRVCERCHQEKPFSDFRLPSNRKSVRPICKECEEKVRQAAKEAEHPVQGMAIYKGHPIHIGSVPEDKPEMFTQVQGLLDFAVHGYLADVREAMKWFGPNMRTPDNVRQVEDMIRTTYESALSLLHENDQDDDQEKED